MGKRNLEYHGATAGKKQPQLYQIWSQIKQRCFNKNHRKYKNYGERGIKMDPFWRRSFVAFQEEIEKGLGPRPSDKHSLGRIDNNKGYWLYNLRWETATQQMRNTRVNHLISHNGEQVPIAQVAEVTGLRSRTIQQRVVRSGMSAQEAATRPLRPGTKRPITWRGETLSLHAWSQRLKMNYQTLRSRIFMLGWSVDRAFTTPVDNGDTR